MKDNYAIYIKTKNLRTDKVVDRNTAELFIKKENPLGLIKRTERKSTTLRLKNICIRSSYGQTKWFTETKQCCLNIFNLTFDGMFFALIFYGGGLILSTIFPFALKNIVKFSNLQGFLRTLWSTDSPENV